MNEDELFKVGLLEIAAELHGGKTCSSGPLPNDQEAEYIAYLCRRLAQWKPSPSYSELYDHAVKGVILAVLSELGINARV